MNITINAASANMGGALTYITNLIREIPDVVDADDRFAIILPRVSLETLAPAADERFIRLIPYPSEGAGTLGRLFFDHVTMRRLLREQRADVLFSSTGFGTTWRPCPEVLLIRNAAYFCPLFREVYRRHGKSFRAMRARRWMSLWSIRATDLALFPSASMRDQVGRFMSLERMATDVLHYGFSREAFVREDAPRPPIAERIAQWKNDGAQVLLHVSAYAVHKNLETLVEALGALKREGRRLKFINTIDRAKTSDKAEFDGLTSRVEALGLGDVFESSGHLKYEQLHHLYRATDLFVFPSCSESFGHPTIEAMCCGLPIVASDIAINRELCGDAASYFDVFDVADCARVLRGVLDNPEETRAMGERSLSRSRRFSWQSHATALMDVFRRASRRA